jgi:hypothetical protein
LQTQQAGTYSTHRRKSHREERHSYGASKTEC